MTIWPFLGGLGYSKWDCYLVKGVRHWNHIWDCRAGTAPGPYPCQSPALHTRREPQPSGRVTGELATSIVEANARDNAHHFLLCLISHGLLEPLSSPGISAPLSNQFMPHMMDNNSLVLVWAQPGSALSLGCFHRGALIVSIRAELVYFSPLTLSRGFSRLKKDCEISPSFWRPPLH